jgi:hypothetical protein
MKNVIVSTLLFSNFIFLSSVHSMDKNIKIECSGKNYLKENSKNWGREENSVTNIVSVYGLSNMSQSKNKSDWWFDSGNSIYTNKKDNDPNQPGNPYWYRDINVSHDYIFIVISGGKDFDKNKKNEDGMNQKNEYRREIRINRITGEWIEKSIDKTFWKDGGWLTMENNIFGKCQKGVQRF